MTRRLDTTSIQVWPNGKTITYHGDTDAPETLKVKINKRWRKANKQEQRDILIARLADMYQKNYIYRNVTILVSDLRQMAFESTSEIARAFDDDEITNLRPDFDDMDKDQLFAYITEHSHDDAPERNDYDNDDDYIDAMRSTAQECTQDAEIYEWYMVDSWLCRQLNEIGECTIDNNYGEFWGRTATGQALIMDGTLQAIAAKWIDR